MNLKTSQKKVYKVTYAVEVDINVPANSRDEAIYEGREEAAAEFRSMGISIPLEVEDMIVVETELNL